MDGKEEIVVDDLDDGTSDDIQPVVSDRIEVDIQEDDADQIDVEPSEEVAEEASEEVSEETSEEASSDEPWYDEETLDYASGYGLTENELKKFSDRSDLDKFTLLLGSRYKRAPQAEMGSTPGATPDEGKSQPPEGKEEWKPPLDLGDFEEDYDEREMRLLKSHNELAEQVQYLTSQQQRVEQIAAQQRKEAEWAAFDRETNNLDESLFGKWSEDSALPSEAHTNREKLYHAVEQINYEMLSSLQDAGLPPRLPSLKTRVKEAAQRVFGDKLNEARIKDQTARVASQSKKRRPANSTAASRPSGPPADEREVTAEDVLNSKEWKSKMREIYANNG